MDAVTLVGADAARYEPVLDGIATASIRALPLTVTGTFTVADRVFHGTTRAEPTGTDLSLHRVLAGEIVTLIPVAAGKGAAAGTDQTVTLNLRARPRRCPTRTRRVGEQVCRGGCWCCSSSVAGP